ncbi:MAG: hypothetical protein QXR28_02385 [Nitrososphaerota archaeon]
MFLRERTSYCVGLCGLYLVFLGLSFRDAAEALRPFVKRSHVSVWRWLRGFQGSGESCLLGVGFL